MQPATFHNAGQFAAVALASSMLLADPRWAQLVVLIISFSMAFTMSCAMAVGYYYSSHGIEKLSRQHAALLGTQFGGILCYLVMICQAYELIH